MAFIIAVAGKGGVGKTTISAMLVQYLIKIDKPVLAVDADPNSNLNVALGMKYEETIADVREEAKRETPEGFSKSEFFGLRLEETLVEGDGFDLLVMGRPEGPGCYCAVNNILRDYLAKISKKYKFVVIDNEAGMEHLSRRTAADIDLLLLVTDPTMVGISSAINAFNTAKSAGVKIKDIELIINKSIPSTGSPPSESSRAKSRGSGLILSGRPKEHGNIAEVSKGELEPDKLKLIENAGLKIGGYIGFQEDIEKNSESGNPVKNPSGEVEKSIDAILGLVKTSRER